MEEEQKFLENLNEKIENISKDNRIMKNRIEELEKDKEITNMGLHMIAKHIVEIAQLTEKVRELEYSNTH